MNKENENENGNENENSKPENGWEFPDIQTFENFSQDLLFPSGNDNFQDDDDKEAKKEPAKSDLELQLEEKINEYNTKAKILNDILVKLNEPLATLDEQLINILQDMIKKIISKIISKEIQADPELMKKMIEELKALIHEKNGLINVNLSEEDFNRMQSGEEKIPSILMNKELHSGDVVVQSKETEIRALLAERIDLLMGKLNG